MTVVRQPKREMVSILTLPGGRVRPNALIHVGDPLAVSILTLPGGGVRRRVVHTPRFDFTTKGPVQG